MDECTFPDPHKTYENAAAVTLVIWLHCPADAAEVIREYFSVSLY